MCITSLANCMARCTAKKVGGRAQSRFSSGAMLFLGLHPNVLPIDVCEWKEG
ncbi:hypothetical protein BofuT4_P058840.1 [Botrytis cinerea T4]|uniref:Uncharacterized protein n=1 Tax=Botryotinia fuckeliana (strain T4) TaxID=999810 RepID=G2XUY4_BOTF4|nr:hypothetical protein BofuT4_P058840.1 [Botrytis cinerea T4]